MVNCSIGMPSVLGTVRTIIWTVVFCSNSWSTPASLVLAPSSIIPALSTTYDAGCSIAASATKGKSMHARRKNLNNQFICCHRKIIGDPVDVFKEARYLVAIKKKSPARLQGDNL